MTENKTCITVQDRKIVATCPDFYTENDHIHCKRAKKLDDFCFSCSHPKIDSECIVDKWLAGEPEREAERLRKAMEEKAKTEAWLNRPKIQLKCCKCGTLQEFGIEEYQDKRRRKKHEPVNEQWCEKCNWFTEHEWILKDKEKPLVRAAARNGSPFLNSNVSRTDKRAGRLRSAS